MSGHGFHVHGPHDHAVEHGSQSGDNFASRIAVMTAVLSTVGALFSYSGGATQNDAMLMKNAAAIKKTEAANQWNYYQAKSNKQNLAELSVSLEMARMAVADGITVTACTPHIYPGLYDNDAQGIHRAVEAGSVDKVISAAQTRPAIIETIEAYGE